jgi:hypothetical protein
MISFNSGDKVDENASEIQKQKEFISKTMDVVKDFEEKGAKPKIYGKPAYKTEHKKNGKATTNS